MSEQPIIINAKWIPCGKIGEPESWVLINKQNGHSLACFCESKLWHDCRVLGYALPQGTIRWLISKQFLQDELKRVLYFALNRQIILDISDQPREIPTTTLAEEAAPLARCATPEQRAVYENIYVRGE